MNIRHTTPGPLAIALAGALLLGAGTAHAADDGPHARPMALRAIMQEMGRNMQAVTDGIARSDWKLVERNAALLADHGQPPDEEKARIIGFFGAEMGRFKGYDSQAHDLSLALGAAARTQDGKAVIAAFGQLQSACLACHNTFREPFLARFYASKPAP